MNLYLIILLSLSFVSSFPLWAKPNGSVGEMETKIEDINSEDLKMNNPPSEIIDSEVEAPERPWKDIRKEFKYQNIKVPNQLWDQVRKLLEPSLGEGKDLDDFALIPISLSIELLTEDTFVFKEQVNYKITFVEGGGTIDFFDYLVGKGEFFIRLSPHLTDDTPFHLLYISESPGKKVEGLSWGNGCGRIYDLSEGARHFIYDQGMKVTSARRHHMHLLAGTYVFFQLVEEKLLLGYIRLTDSRFPQFSCRD